MTVEAVKVDEINPAVNQAQELSQPEVDVKESTAEAKPEVKSEVKPVWPEDWRQQLAGEDKTALKTLERLTDPKALLKSYNELRAKLSSGDVQLKLPENATPEEKAEWRKQQGIPETPEGYKLDLGKYQVTEADKPVFDQFQKYAHENDLPPGAVNATFKWYLSQVEQAATIQKELDDSYKQQSEDALRNEWGSDFRANVNVINNFLSKAPEGLRQSFESARLEDGTKLNESPEFKKWLASTALELNPAARILPMNASPNAGADRIQAIEKMQRENYAAYMKDDDLQTEYLQLLEARQKINSRG